MKTEKEKQEMCCKIITIFRQENFMMEEARNVLELLLISNKIVIDRIEKRGNHVLE